MEKFEQTVWTQHGMRIDAGLPTAPTSHVSMVLSAFSTLMQRHGGGRDDVGFVLRLADCLSDWIPAPATAMQPLPSTVATNIDGVSAAERLVLTPERVPEVLGKLIQVHEHGNFTDKQALSWGRDTRHMLQSAHTQFVTQDDLEFVEFIERDDPVPAKGAKGVGIFFRRKWEQLPNVNPKWAEDYTKPDSLRRRYQRLKKDIERMGLSSKRNV